MIRRSDEHPDLREIGLDSEDVFRGRLLHVKRDTVRLPDGSEATREYIVHPGAVMIMPRLPDGKLLFERQFRYPHQRVFIEFPAGKIDSGEDPLATAKRELLEETGYTAARWAYVATMHPLITYSTEHIAIYAADELDLRRRAARCRRVRRDFCREPGRCSRLARSRRGHRRQDDAGPVAARARSRRAAAGMSVARRSRDAWSSPGACRASDFAMRLPTKRACAGWAAGYAIGAMAASRRWSAAPRRRSRR